MYSIDVDKIDDLIVKFVQLWITHNKIIVQIHEHNNLTKIIIQ